MRKRTGLLVLILLVSLFAGCLGGSGDTPGKITGNILDKDTGQKITGQDVHIILDGAPTVTTTDGTYSFSNVTAGTRNLKVQAVGFKLSTTSVQIKAGRTVTKDVQLVKDSGSVEGIIENFTDAGLALIGLWELELATIVDSDLAPFAESVAPQLELLVTPFTEDGGSAGERIIDASKLNEGKLKMSYEENNVRTVYDLEMDPELAGLFGGIEEAFRPLAVAPRTIFEASFEQKQDGVVIGQGRAQIQADLDYDLLEDWLEYWNESFSRVDPREPVQVPGNFFFTVLDFQLIDVWFQTEEGGLLEVAGELRFDDNLLTLSGSVQSAVVEFQGELTMTISPSEDLQRYTLPELDENGDPHIPSGLTLPFFLERAEFDGMITLVDTVRLTGQLEMEFVKNDFLSGPIPSRAVFNGEYQQLTSGQLIFGGRFELNWTNAETANPLSGVFLTVSFDFDFEVWEPGGLPIGVAAAGEIVVRQDSEYTRIGTGDWQDEARRMIRVSYKFGSRVFEGELQFGVYLYEDGREETLEIDAVLTDNFGYKLKIDLGEETFNDDEVLIAVIKNPEGQTEAEFWRLNHLLIVKYADGRIEDLF